MQNRWHPYLWETAKFNRDRDRFSEIEDGAIPSSNCNQSVMHSWFVPISTLVPTENAQSLASLLSGTANFGDIGIG